MQRIAQSILKQINEEINCSELDKHFILICLGDTMNMIDNIYDFTRLPLCFYLYFKYVKFTNSV